MRVLLTGGAGYIGAHTAVALIEAGHDVLIVDEGLGRALLGDRAGIGTP